MNKFRSLDRELGEGISVKFDGKHITLTQNAEAVKLGVPATEAFQHWLVDLEMFIFSNECSNPKCLIHNVN